MYVFIQKKKKHIFFAEYTRDSASLFKISSKYLARNTEYWNVLTWRIFLDGVAILTFQTLISNYRLILMCQFLPNLPEV